MTLYVFLSWIFLVLGGLFEFRRLRKLKSADAFSLISLTFAIAFVLAPSVLYWTSPDDASFTKFTWMQRLPEDVQTYALAALFVIGSYVCIYLGYAASRAKPRHTYKASVCTYLIAGLLLTVGGVIAFFSFLEIVGGPVFAFQTAWLLRVGTPDDLPLAKFAFVKRLSFFVVPGSVFLLQVASKRASLWPVATLGVISALVVLTFMQGRLQLVIYIAPLLLAMWALRHRATPRLAFASFCWVCMIFSVVGGTKTLLQPSAAFVQAPPSITGASPPAETRVATPYYLPQKVVSVGLEFAFPFCNLLSVLTTKPEPRWFIDLVLPIFHLIPKRIVPIGNYLPPRLYELNTKAQIGPVPWGIPVDLISFGYFSLGTLGVALTSFGFGWLARRIELMMPSGNYGDEVFRFSWIVLIGSLVMYGDPNWLVIEQFHWIAALFIYVMITHPKSVGQVVAPSV